MRVPYETMLAEFERVLMKYGFSADRAHDAAEIFAQNSLAGVFSHGLNRFPVVVDYLKKGGIDPASEAECVGRFGAMERWDGHRGFGPLNARRAMARAVELAAGLIVRMETAGSSPERLNRALSCVGFWSQGSEEAAARLLGTLYSAGSLPWRACLRAEIVPQLAGVCNDIIADGVKSYDMYTPYPREMA